MGRPCGSHDHIHIHSTFHRLFKGHGFAAELRRQKFCPLNMAVGHIDFLHAMGNQMLSRKLGHLPGTENQGAGFMKFTQGLFCQFHRRITYGYGVELDAGFRTHPLARSNRPMEKRIEHRARGARLPAHGIGLFDLRKDLSLPQYQRIQAGGYTKQMLNTILIGIVIKIFVDILLIARKIEEELLQSG